MIRTMQETEQTICLPFSFSSLVGLLVRNIIEPLLQSIFHRMT